MYRVLIVDDEQLMREALRIMISRVDGFEVASAVGNGEEAVEICKRGNIDIVFMDIMMPGMSGIEASKKIYMNNSQITIYILSAYSGFEFAREALKVKVKEYISKPVSFAMIKALLEQYKDSHRGNGKLLDTIILLLKGKDFRKVYYEIPKIADELFTGYDEAHLKIICQELILSLAEYVGWLGEEQGKYEALFPITGVLFKEKGRLEFWLYNIMNYAVQQAGIKKYDLLRQVFGYIDANLEKDIGLNEIIDKCAVSQGYLSRIFKQQMNVSVMEYLHMRKLMHAKAYFSFTDLSIADVAFRLGYNESSYFSKVFKKYEGITIYQYKKNNGNME